MTFNFSVKEWMLGNGNGVPIFQFYRQGFNIGNDVVPRWQDVILKGNTSLTLLNAKNDGLNYLKLFGGSVVEKGEPESLTYATVEDEAHSTFDLSKFTVVGSPIVTTDGVATNFSTSNYLASSFKVSNLAGKSWSIRFPLHINEFVNNRIAQFGVGAEDCGFYYLINTNMIWALRLNGTVQYIGRPIAAANTDYIVELIYDKTAGEYTVNYYYNNGTLRATASITSQYELDIITSQPNYVFTFGGANNPTSSGSVDLKQFSITVDGVEVFSGNKTGIDTLKPDDYTPNTDGTYTAIISDDGILGYNPNFELTGYNRINVSLPTLTATDNWKIETLINTGDLTIHPWIIQAIPAENRGLRVRISDNNTYFVCDIASSSLEWFTINYSATVSGGIKPYTDYLISVEKNSRVFTIRIYNASGVQVGSGSWTASSDFSGFAGNEGSYKFGIPSPNGTANINAMKFYINGDLVWQGCLKIPYTLTKDGKKIVDSYYLDRVQDAYNQELPSPYTVLDTTQQTATYYGLSYINSNNGLLKVSNNTIITDGTAETVVTKNGEDTVLSTATAQDLLASSTTNQDIQEVITGTVTKNVGLTYLTGQEAWTKSNDYPGVFYITAYSPMGGTKKANDANIIPSEGKAVSTVASLATAPTWSLAWVDASTLYFKYDDGGATVDEFKAWLNSRYADDNTIFITYPLASAVTSTVTEQPMDIEHGTNTVEITQASINNLELEVSYKSGVLVTIEEIQDAQLDDSVTVTIGDE